MELTLPRPILAPAHLPYITITSEQAGPTTQRNNMMYSALAVLVLVAAAAVAAPFGESPRKSRMMPGGRRTADINEEGVQYALAYAMKEYNKGSNDMYASKVISVIKLEKQIVAGVKYYMEVEIGRTQCTKASSDFDKCELHMDKEMAKSTTCHFTVFTVPWEAKTKLTENQCN